MSYNLYIHSVFWGYFDENSKQYILRDRLF